MNKKNKELTAEEHAFFDKKKRQIEVDATIHDMEWFHYWMSVFEIPEENFDYSNEDIREHFRVLIQERIEMRGETYVSRVKREPSRVALIEKPEDFHFN